MDDNLSNIPVPDGWLEILADGDAELVGGLTLDGNQIIRELYTAAESLEALQAEEQARKATYGR